MEPYEEVTEERLTRAFETWDANYDPANEGDNTPAARAKYLMEVLAAQRDSG